MAAFTTEVTTLNDYSYTFLYFVCKVFVHGVSVNKNCSQNLAMW